MFSTVDTRGSRYLRVYLITERERIPVEVPRWLRKRVTELRAAPSQEKLDGLAERLAKLTWGNGDAHWQAVAVLANGRAGRPLDRAALHPAQNETGTPWFHKPGRRTPIRPLPNSGDDSCERGIIQFHSLRAELWHYTYNADRNRLEGELQIATESPGIDADA